MGLYRRRIRVPASFAGKRVLWHFDGVFAGAEVFVNGQKVGYHESGYSAFELDITSAIKPGAENIVAVRVSKLVTSSPLDSGDYWALGGIYRETYFLAVPKTSIDDVIITTDLDDQYRDATLSTRTKILGTPGETVTVQGALIPFGNAPDPKTKFFITTKIGPTGESWVDLSQPVKSPRLWSAEKPNLYYLLLTLAKDGKVVERVQERFGFREIEIRNGVLLWNGKPIKLTGTCRHEEWSKLGHALTEHEWQTDVAMIKAANINSVRTSHYNHAERFLEICDERGLYLLDEAAGCWADMESATLTPYMVLHAQEMYARDKNRPSVLAWSIGNESGVGKVNRAAFDWIKKADPTRPAFISWASKWADPRMDFDDRHYPELLDLQQRANNEERKTTPMLLSEQPHLFYGDQDEQYDPGFHEAWVYSMTNVWDVVWSAPGIAGSYVWEWQDQGLLDKFPGNQGRDPKTGLRDNNRKGFVDGFRNPKSEYYDVKMTYSPVVVEARTFTADGGKATIPLRNRYTFTDLSELTCRWEACGAKATIGKGKVKVALPPATLGQLTLPVAAETQSIRLEFVHPDGNVVYTTILDRTGTSHLPRPPVAAKETVGDLRIGDLPDAVQITNGQTRIVIDRKTGLIRSWRVGDQDMVRSGPVLNLGERRPPGGPLPAKNFLISKEDVRLTNVTVSTLGTTVTVSGDAQFAESKEPLGRFSYTLTMTRSGDAYFAWQMEWTAPNANAWELGVKFALPATTTRMNWVRDTVWTDYPANHPGAPVGTTTSDDIAFRSTKRNVRWTRHSGPGRYELSVLRGASPLHTRARAENGAITLFASIGVEPPKNHSEVTPEMDIHLAKGRTYGGSFSLRVSMR